MFSFEQSFAILGDPRLADRLERVSYNALPGTLSSDMWSHQYDQQPNQIACTRAHRQWSTNGNDSNLFGLAPNFGCCTANLHQGWPKLVQSLWMETASRGLVTGVYAPNTLNTEVSGASVRIDENTDYPFRGAVQLEVHPTHDVRFAMLLRVPDWTQSVEVKVNGTPINVPQPDCRVGPDESESDRHACDFERSFVHLDRTWKDGDRIDVQFSTTPRVTRWFDSAAVFESGPLVFSLPLRDDWSKLKQYGEKSADWQIVPTTDWNYGVELGDCNAVVADHPTHAVPFDTDAPPVTLAVEARKLPGWGKQENSAAPPPQSPVESTEPSRRLTLIPYGAAKLRITEFPVLNDKSSCGTAGAAHAR